MPAVTSTSTRWQILKIIVAVVVNFIFLYITARYVDKENFGILAIANAIIGLLSFFAEFGFGAALIQKKNITEVDINEAFTNTFFISLLLLVVFSVIGFPIAQFYQYPVLKLIFPFAASLLVIRSFGVVSNALLIKELNFKGIFISEAIGLLIGNLILGCSMAYMDFQIWSILFAQLTSVLLSTIIVNIIKPIRFKIHFAFNSFKDSYIFKYGLKLTLYRFFNQLSNQADILLLGRYHSAAAMGLFERSKYSTGMSILYYGNIFDGILFSHFSNFAEGKTEVLKFYKSFVKLTTIIFSFISAFLIFNSYDIIFIVFGENWLEMESIFRIFVFIIFVMTLSRFGDTIVRSLNLMDKGMYIKIVYFIFLITCLIQFRNNLIFASWGILICATIHSIMMLIFCFKHLDYRLNYFLKDSLATVLICGIIFLINFISASFLFLMELGSLINITLGSIFLFLQMSFLHFYRKKIFAKDINDIYNIIVPL